MEFQNIIVARSKIHFIYFFFLKFYPNWKSILDKFNWTRAPSKKILESSKFIDKFDTIKNSYEICI